MSKLFIANWKANKTLEEVVRWMDEFEALIEKKIIADETKIILAPPYPFLLFVSNRLLNKKIHSQTFLACQDLSPFPAGSYTGAVCTRNLEGLDVRYAIVGHSERRRYFKETQQEVANKVTQAVKSGITPIVCVDADYIDDQASAIEQELLKKCIVAYEPLLAIGSGENAPIKKVSKIRKKIKETFGEVPVIYGGSVSLENIDEYVENVDGVLVGGASLEAQTFADLIS